jgi:hypothetical protein
MAETTGYLDVSIEERERLAAQIGDALAADD